MPIALPNLDDRRWADLVDEGRALIPVLSPEWTDHNASDPGITLLELFAFLAEQDAYRINRVSDRHRLRLLALADVAPQGPKPSRVLLQFTPKGTAPVMIPAGTECSASATDNGIRFRTLRPAEATPLTLEAVLTDAAPGFSNTGLALQRRELPYLFGSQPAPGISVYFGLSATPDSGTLSLGFLWSGSRIDEWERRRILGEASSATIPLHHSVRVQWEASVVAPGGYRWAAIVADDNTRSMTLNGTVQLPIPSGGTSIVLGREPARFYVRCRLLAGQFDRPPRLSQVFLNAVEGEQAIPARQAGSLPIASDPESPVLPDPSVVLGVANGQPSQQLRMTGAPVVAESVALYSLETTAAGTAWRKWDARVDLIASGPADAHFVLDASRGTISFGDAHHGRVAPVGAVFAAAYETTRGAGGQTGAGVVSTIVDPSLAATAYIANPGAAEGGADAETLAQAMGRAIELREAVWRAMTAKDIRTIALEAPGTLVGRAEVKLNSYPGLKCVQAHGVISVFILPDAPGKRPQPSAGLLRVLAARLNNRRIVGTRFIVLGPDYVTVTVQASVKQVAYADRSQVAANVKAALNAFFDPLTGGPDGAGWPFGRGVYRSEVLQVMDQTAGVDYVRSLDLVADTCAPRCGNLCLGPTMLVATGDHEIEVV